MSNNSIQNTATTNFANAIGGTDNVNTTNNVGDSTAADGDINGKSSSFTTAITAPAATVNSTNANSNGVWSGLRTSLFSTAALIADEHGDPLAATQ